MSTSPPAAWALLAAGNERFAAGAAVHPHQDPARRAELASGQHPIAAVLSCSDSRVGPEVVLDQGLGDVFVVRNAGQVADASAIASLEYAVAALGAPLLVVLAHESCGAVRAAIEAAGPDAPLLPPLIAAHVAAIAPAVEVAGTGDVEAVGHAHLEATVRTVIETSDLIAAAVADGSVAVVGAEYLLATGRVERRFALGDAG